MITKMKMRKAGCLFSLIKLFVLTVIILCLILYFSISFIVPTAVHYTGKLVGIDMGLGSFSFSITEQSVELENFYINNPEGFTKDAKVVNLDKARVALGLGSDLFLKDLIVIDEVVVEGYELFIEYGGGMSLLSNNSNINALLAKVKSEEAKEDAEQKAEQEAVATQGSTAAQSEKEYKIIIKKISFKNGKLMGGVSGVNLNLPMPDFEVLDVGVAEGGVSPLDASLTILTSVSYQAMTAIAKSTGSTVKDAVGSGYESIKSIFNGF